jgi:hypothetical protein
MNYSQLVCGFIKFLSLKTVEKSSDLRMASARHTGLFLYPRSVVGIFNSPEPSYALGASQNACSQSG